MTDAERDQKITEHIQALKDLGCKIRWWNGGIFVIGKPTTDGQEVAQQELDHQPAHGGDREQGGPEEGADESTGS
jgi:hypothetical protein